MLAEWVEQLLGYASGALAAIREDEHYPSFMAWAREEGASLVGLDQSEAAVDDWQRAVELAKASSFHAVDVRSQEQLERAVENVGVSPDVEVVEWPKDILAGRDPQLEKAVEIALKDIRSGSAQARPASYRPPAKR